MHSLLLHHPCISYVCCLETNYIYNNLILKKENTAHAHFYGMSQYLIPLSIMKKYMIIFAIQQLLLCDIQKKLSLEIIYSFK